MKNIQLAAKKEHDLVSSMARALFIASWSQLHWSARSNPQDIEELSARCRQAAEIYCRKAEEPPRAAAEQLPVKLYNNLTGR